MPALYDASGIGEALFLQPTHLARPGDGCNRIQSLGNVFCRIGWCYTGCVHCTPKPGDAQPSCAIFKTDVHYEKCKCF